MTEGYASDHGLLNGSVMMVDLVDGTTTDPWPDLETVGIAGWIDDDSLWYSSGATGPGRPAGGCGWTGVARSGGAATRSSATR